MPEIKLLPNFIDQAATPVAQKVGGTIASIWGIVFGGIDAYAQKKEIQRIHKLDSFKKELEDKVSAIPEDNLIEPQLHIIGPTLEASKYYFENDELRNMFSNLIAASINIDKIDQTHPSFVEIIKQLSPLDAMNLRIMKNDNRFPIVDYRIKTKNGGLMGAQSNVFLENQDITDVKLNAASITNLSRLGLTEVDYTHQLANEEVYNKFKENDYYKYITDQVETQLDDYECVDIKKGMVFLTPLGINFTTICIE